MQQILGSIRHYYIDTVAPFVITVSNASQGVTQEIAPIDRFHFLLSVGFALISLIQTVASLIFSFIRTLLTCGRNQEALHSLLKDLHDVIVYMTVIPIGYIGAIMPSTINYYLLGIPPEGLTIQHPSINAAWPRNVVIVS